MGGCFKVVDAENLLGLCLDNGVGYFVFNTSNGWYFVDLYLVVGVCELVLSLLPMSLGLIVLTAAGCMLFFMWFCVSLWDYDLGFVMGDMYGLVLG